MSPVDRIFVRMGAKDHIMAGQGTFLTELLETTSMLLARALFGSLILYRLCSDRLRSPEKTTKKMSDETCRIGGQQSAEKRDALMDCVGCEKCRLWGKLQAVEAAIVTHFVILLCVVIVFQIALGVLFLLKYREGASGTKEVKAGYKGESTIISLLILKKEVRRKTRKQWRRDLPWESCMLAVYFEWKKIALPVMEYYTEATDGSFTEQKESALIWHYQEANPDSVMWQAKQLLDHLESVLANDPVVVK
ncbi:hypothetical protein RHMOL_Rhmol07G0162500 [Rhododendron molle]|uniref:Uncharacterized protein n=1 Tax=Rhododendron molle TaxID=49168 RepID=A0ACC0N386_RHOML|nr:hypothetical protein RHMOL_Rhmol07G0162500 [Rhododendron molle]